MTSQSLNVVAPCLKLNLKKKWFCGNCAVLPQDRSRRTQDLKSMDKVQRMKMFKNSVFLFAVIAILKCSFDCYVLMQTNFQGKCSLSSPRKYSFQFQSLLWGEYGFFLELHIVNYFKKLGAQDISINIVAMQ